MPYKLLKYFIEPTFPSTMETLLVKFNVDKFGEHEGSAIKTMGNEFSLEAGLYINSNVSREFNLWTGKFVEFIVILQSNPL